MGNIRIRLMSDLSVGNGESVGYGIDSDICTDIYGFPYIPGKRILGCLRDAALQLGEYGLDDATEENINEIFGNANGMEGKLSIGNARLPGIDSLHSYILSLKKESKPRDYLIRQSTEEKIIRLYSSVRGQTKIGVDGKAEGGSLRFVRVLNQYDPISGNELEFICTVNISKLNETQIELVQKACKILRHIGLNRNRGLGNVLVIPDLKTDNMAEVDSENVFSDHSSLKSEQIVITYQVEFDSPITVQEYMESGSQIKARTLIGVFSGIYLNNHENVDEIFEKIFLDGSVKWSALTPVINGITSQPVPAMMMKLKNGDGKLINSFACCDKEWKQKKPKSLDGYYASFDKEGRKLFISQPETEIKYHNRMNELNGNDRERKGLYTQESLKQGMIYGGYVILPKELFSNVKELLSVKRINLGRSKKVQYGSATIMNIEAVDYVPEIIKVDDDEPVIAILRSDLVLQNNASFRVDNIYVRNIIAEETGLRNILPSGMNDICRYHVITGYHTMWQMQKPKIQAVMGGSVFSFLGRKGEYLSEFSLGEYQQEGLGMIELVPMSKLSKITDIEYGQISVKKNMPNDDVKQSLEKMLLLEAVLMELREYAFKFKKGDDSKRENEKLLKNIPVRRLRQMLLDAKDVKDLWTMVESMKTSDVSSESNGKKDKSLKLLEMLYGENRSIIDLGKLIEDEALLKEVKKNPEVYEQTIQNWKEPLFTLLHMVHYQRR